MLAPIGEKDEVLEVGFGAGFGFARRVGVAGGAEEGVSILPPLGATEGLEEAEGVDLIIASIASRSSRSRSKGRSSPSDWEPVPDSGGARPSVSQF